MTKSITNNYTYYTNTSKAVNTKSGEYWFEEKGSNSEISMQSFLQLMIAQLQNQDFNNTTDTNEFVAQMAQFSTIQAMNDLASYSKTNVATSLIGREVAYKTTVGSTTQYEYGVVEAVSFSTSGEPKLYINNAEFSLSDIAQVYASEDKGTVKDSVDALAGTLLNGVDDLVAEIQANTNKIIANLGKDDEDEETTSLADILID